jgi:hypothetical protein
MNQPATQASTVRLEQRRSERNARRELLFQVVRESMVRVGVLSSGFKFKVLSLDQRGRTFLVMIEMAAEFAGEVERLAEIEALIANSSKVRHDILVQAVYWRFTDSVMAKAAQSVASAPNALPQAAPAAMPSASVAGAPAAMASSTSFEATVPLHRPYTAATSMLSSAAVGAGATGSVDGPKAVDPIAQDEVEALRRALATGVNNPLTGSGAASRAAAGAAAGAIGAAGAVATGMAQAAPSPLSKAAAAAAERAASLEAIRNKLLLTGYEDTEMSDPDEPPPALSTTQYGDLH